MLLPTLIFRGIRFHVVRPFGDEASKCPDHDSHQEPDSCRYSFWLLAGAADDSIKMTALRKILPYLATSRPAALLDDTEVVEEVAEALQRRRLKLVECGTERLGGTFSWEAGAAGSSASSSGAGSRAGDRERPPAPTGRQRKEVKSWVEIVLLDHEGKPAAGARYQIRLPDGSTQEGTLDADGHARVSGIDPGTCEITFPDFHEKEWQPS